MPLLDQTGWKAETFTRGSMDEASQGAVIVDFCDLEAALSSNRVLGVEIPNTVSVEALRQYLDRLSLIAITFPSFSDGRGFSIAKSLRNAGFRGTLRAVGPLIADQFAYALACGFDEVELPEALAARQPVAIWLAAAKSFRATYQRNHAVGGLSILDRRRASQEASR